MVFSLITYIWSVIKFRSFFIKQYDFLKVIAFASDEWYISYQKLVCVFLWSWHEIWEISTRTRGIQFHFIRQNWKLYSRPGRFSSLVLSEIFVHSELTRVVLLSNRRKVSDSVINQTKQTKYKFTVVLWQLPFLLSAFPADFHHQRA